MNRASESKYDYAAVRFPHADWNKPLYTIGVAAELAGVHPQTLRTYEQKGLITPKRTSGGTRMYSLADLDRLALINELTEEGVNLAGVMRILDLQRRLDDVEGKLDNMHRRYQRLANRLSELDPDATTVTAIVRIDDNPRWIRSAGPGL